MARELRPDHHQQADVQRGRLVEGLVEGAQRSEQGRKHADDVGLSAAKAQREQHEARHRDQLHGEQAQGKTIDRTRAATKQEGEPIEQVDRPVGHDCPWHEGDRPLPVVTDRGHLLKPRCPLVGGAIAEEEEGPQEQQPGDAAPPLDCARIDHALVGAHGKCFAHAGNLRATDTVKMPHSSMRCSIFSKPAEATSWSISC